MELSRIGNGDIYSMAASPDMKMLAVASSIGIWLYDFGSMSPVKLLDGHKDFVQNVAWASDGELLASASRDGTVRVWNVARGEEMLVLEGHRDSVNGVAWSPDGEYLASVSHDATVRLWSARDGEIYRILKAPSCGTLRCADILDRVVWSTDGRQVAAIGDSGSGIHIWNVSTGELQPLLADPAFFVSSVAWSPDGKLAASGSQDGLVRVWNADTGAELHTIRGHKTWAGSIVWSPDGSKLASGGGDGALRIWDASSGKLLLATTLEQKAARSLLWSQDGSQLVTVSVGRHWESSNDVAIWNVQVWDTSTGEELQIHTVEVHTRWADEVTWSPDGAELAYTSSDGTVRIWDTSFQQEIQVIHVPYSAGLPLSWSPDWTQFAAGGACAVRIWDAQTGIEARVWKVGVSEGASAPVCWVGTVAWSPDGKRLASGSDVVRIWDVESGQELYVLGYEESGVSKVTWSPDGAKLASGSWWTVYIWDADSGAMLQGLDVRHVDSMVWSPDATHLAVGDATQIYIWDTLNWTQTQLLRGHQGDSIYGLAWSPDGTRLASGGDDHTVRIWDATNGHELFRLEGHKDLVFSVAWSPDGLRLATASRDGTVRIWGSPQWADK